MSQDSFEQQVYPASAVQRQFWLLQRIQPETRAYHVPSVFLIRGHLDVEALHSSFTDLVTRHESLRTTFEERDGLLFQRVHRDLALSVTTSLAVELPESSEVDAEVRKPFDLHAGPLLRIRIWQATNDEQIVAWTMHHIITDLTTKDVLSRELNELYARRVRGVVDGLAPQIEQYSSFAETEMAWHGSEAALLAEEYFAAHLGPTTVPLALPENFPRPILQSDRGARVDFELDEMLGSRLRHAARERSTKPYLLLLAAYALLLGRYSSAERLVLGIPFTNRRRQGSQSTAGCFVNTLPFAVDFTGAPTFRQLMDQIRQSMLGHHRHQEISLDRILGRVRPLRDASRNPLYQAGFTFEHPMGLELLGTSAENLRIHAGGAQLDVFLTMWETDGRFFGHMEYCTDLYAPATMRQFVNNFLTLLESLLSKGEQVAVPASQLDFVHALEIQQVVEVWNRTGHDFGRSALMHELFLEQASRTPDAVAVRRGGQQLTYRELADYARALAHSLRSEGIQDGDRVGIYMSRSIEMVVSVFAVLLAGAAYVPIDPDFPLQRIECLLEDATPKCVLGLATTAKQWQYPIVGLRIVDLANLIRMPDAPMTRVGPNDAAYVIFTSGSTGRPKGVAVGHGAICNSMLWMQSTFQLRANDVLVQSTPYSFDVSTWELLWVFVAGAQLEVPEEGIHRDPAALAELIEQAGVTTIHFVPSMLHVFLEQAPLERCRSLRRVLCIGEALGSEVVRRFHQSLNCELHNLYGPTEATVQASWWHCEPGSVVSPIPIGRPIANTRFYILDPQMRPVPVGVAGELYIGGIQVAIEYVSRPDLTARAFMPDPFTSGSVARMYRTGDLARWLPDGNVVFLGRTDFQVKVRGVRIELGEIETVLERHHSVAQCVVVARQVGGGIDAQLIAYLSGPETKDSSVGDAMRAYAAKHLPSYMVPNRFIVVDALPLNSNGKIDRKALPTQVAETDVPLAVATNDVERWISTQWCELLEVDHVGINDSFFEIGGTSLMAARLISRIRDQLTLEVPLVRLFEYPSVARLSAFLESLAVNASAKDGTLLRAREHAAQRRTQVQRQTQRRPRTS